MPEAHMSSAGINFYEGVGERIHAARVESGLSLLECASRVGLKSAVAFQRYEAGKRKLPIHLLPELATLFGKPLAFFFEGSVPQSILRWPEQVLC